MISSLLFVPGFRCEFFEKSFTYNPACVIFDLEDAVPLGRKAESRRMIKEFLTDCPLSNIGLRINNLHTKDGREDLHFLLNANINFNLVIPSKIRSSTELTEIKNSLNLAGKNDVKLYPLIEIPEAVENLFSIASNIGEGGGLVFGSADLSAETGIQMSWEGMLYARSKLVMCAAAYDLAAIDTPFFDVSAAEEGLREECMKAKRMGFVGKLCVHPSQVRVVNEIFNVSQDDIRRAQKIIHISERMNTASISIDSGVFVGPPFVKMAAKLLEASKR
jgi:(S)-citramalyl-CoA lyase